MARWATHRVDGNAADIYKAAARCGFSVEKIDRPVDAIFGIYDQTVAVEIKLPNGRARPDQVKFFRTFKGKKVVLRHIGDVLALHREMRERHDLLFPKKKASGGKEEGGEKETGAEGKEGCAEGPALVALEFVGGRRGGKRAAQSRTSRL